MWIRFPTESAKPKNPTSHPMIRITTINQIKSLIISVFLMLARLKLLIYFEGG